MDSVGLFQPHWWNHSCSSWTETKLGQMSQLKELRGGTVCGDGGRSSRLLLSSALVYLPAVLAQVARLKRRHKRKRREAVSGTHSKPSKHTHTHTHVKTCSSWRKSSVQKVSPGAEWVQPASAARLLSPSLSEGSQEPSAPPSTAAMGGWRTPPPPPAAFLTHLAAAQQINRQRATFLEDSFALRRRIPNRSFPILR